MYCTIFLFEKAFLNHNRILYRHSQSTNNLTTVTATKANVLDTKTFEFFILVNVDLDLHVEPSHFVGECEENAGRGTRLVSSASLQRKKTKDAFFWDYSGIGILGIDGICVLMGAIPFSE